MKYAEVKVEPFNCGIDSRENDSRRARDAIYWGKFRLKKGTAISLVRIHRPFILLPMHLRGPTCRP